MKKLKQSFPLKSVTENVSDFILQGLCPRYSGRVNTQWSVFSIKMIKALQVFFVTLILAHCWVFFYCLDLYFWGFFPRHRESAVKDHRKLACAETFQQKSSFLLCLPVKTTSFPPDQL